MPIIDRTERRRETAAYVTKRNGAWLIEIVGAAAADTTNDATISCASSIAVAKREAIQMASELGFEPAWRWPRSEYGNWVLEAWETDEWIVNTDDWTTAEEDD